MANAVYQLAGGAHKISVNFQTKAGSYMPITVLADTGSDITLISREDGERIGFAPSMGGEPFMVGGVGAGAVPFTKFATMLKFQSLQPVRVDFGVAKNYNALRDNLLGREDILDNYNVTYSKTGVIFSTRATRALHAWQLFRYQP